MGTVTKNMSEWTKLFPRQVSEDCISSGTFIKQLTKIVISSITYLKDAFSEDSYTVEKFAGLKIHILKTKCKDNNAKFLSSSLLDAFEAFDKRYLHKLALYFYENECRVEGVIESHVFEYTYKDDVASMNLYSHTRGSAQTKYSFQSTYKQTTRILKTYVVLMNSSQKSLPSNYGMSVRLYYYDDTPADYHAPGFVADDDDVDHLNHIQSLKVGSLSTPFHGLQLYSYFVNNSRTDPIAQNGQVLETECEDSEDRPGTRGRMTCPCGRNYTGKHGVDELLNCHYCNKLQHAACFGILNAEAANMSRHCCALCYDEDSSRPPTDLKLASLDPKHRAALSMFRRTLQQCVGLHTIDAPALAAALRVSRSEAGNLLMMLQQQGVTSGDGDTDLNQPQEINAAKLKSATLKYFYSKEDNIVCRLLADIETSISQDEFRLSDPIGEALDPVGRLDIHNTSNIGRVIKPVNKPVAEDSTLKQYKEAVVLDEIEEPLFTSSIEKKACKRRQKVPLGLVRKGKSQRIENGWK